MSKVTVIQAAFLTGKHRQTINKFTKNGRLSYSHNEEGAKVIDVSELERVFPLVKTIEELERAELAEEQDAPSESQPGVTEQVAVLKAQLQAQTT